MRAAIIALSFGGGKSTKPGDIFHSIKIVEQDQKDTVLKKNETENTWAMEFLSAEMSEESPFDKHGNLKKEFMNDGS